MSEQKSAIMACAAPQMPTCVTTGPPIPHLPGANMACWCVEPSPTPPSCTVSIVYPSNYPQGVYVGAKDAGCDGAGMEIAFAVLLAKLLTAPPLP